MSQEKIAELRKSWAAQPRGRTFLQLAEALRDAGNGDEAVEVLEKGLATNQGLASARQMVADLLLKAGQDERALTHLQRLFEIEPENLKVNRQLAEIAYRRADRELALKHYKIVQIFDPGDRMAQLRVTELSAQAEPPPPPAPVESLSASAAVNDARTIPPAPAGDPAATARYAPPAPAGPSTDGAFEEPELETPLTAPELAEFGAPGAAAPPAAANPFGDLMRSQAGIPAIPDRGVDLLAEVAAPEPPPAAPPAPLAPSAPPVRSEPAAAADEDEPAEEITTETLAEIYVSQGHLGKAIRIYERLLLQNPADGRIRTRIESLQAESREASAPPREPALRLPSPERRRKIVNLQNWLTTIRKEHDA